MAHSVQPFRIPWRCLRPVVRSGLCIAMGFLLIGDCAAQTARHNLYDLSRMPPGAIGRRQLLRSGPKQGYFQPVHLRAPGGANVALAGEAGFDQSYAGEILVGLQVGPVYCFRVSEIPQLDGVRLYPTVELIDRLYPPGDYAAHFPVVIDLPLSDLRHAARGTLVTRVIYLENPQTASSQRITYRDEQPQLNALPTEDPLQLADALGRPMAIVRIGSRTMELDDGTISTSFSAPPSQPLDIGILSQPPQVFPTANDTWTTPIEDRFPGIVPSTIPSLPEGLEGPVTPSTELPLEPVEVEARSESPRVIQAQFIHQRSRRP